MKTNNLANKAARHMKTQKALLSSVISILLLLTIGCGAEENTEATPSENRPDGTVMSDNRPETSTGNPSAAQEKKLEPQSTRMPQPGIAQTADSGITSRTEEKKKECRIIMFHNNAGPMCILQLEFLKTIRPKFPALAVEEHLTYEQGSRELMYSMESQYGTSEGESGNFGFLPITFINGHAYSGFNDQVKQKIEQDVREVCG